MVKIVSIALVTALLSGCSSLEMRNVGKTITTTGVVYVIAGGLPAIASAATSMAYDEIIPDEPKVDDIKTKEQAVAYVATSWGMNALYAFIAFLLITNVLVPFITRKWGYNEAKNKYKEVVFVQDKE